MHQAMQDVGDPHRAGDVTARLNEVNNLVASLQKHLAVSASRFYQPRPSNTSIQSASQVVVPNEN